MRAKEFINEDIGRRGFLGALGAGAMAASGIAQEEGRLLWSNKQGITEAFTTPYSFKWEEGEYGDWDATSPGKQLEIGFTRDHDYPDRYQVEFWRNHSVGVTGDGDAQRIFSTVLEAIKQFVVKIQPEQLHFTASKEVEQGQNPESRAKLYDRMVQRYASIIGYKAHRMNTGMDIQYELHKG